MNPTFEPEIHGVAHTNQRIASLLALDLLQGAFLHQPARNARYLDLGCGTGQFTHDELLKRCPPPVKVVAADMAVEMIQYARDNFSHPRITHDVLDIRKDVSSFVTKHGKFERIYSFFALHWTKDQKNAFRNIASLLADGGECLLLFAARTTWLTVYRRLTVNNPRQLYSQVLNSIIPPSQDVDDKVGLISYMSKLLESSNLKPHTCEVVSFVDIIPDPETLIQSEAKWNPIAPLLPEAFRSEFIEDLTREIRNLWSEEADGIPRYFSDVFLVRASKL